MGLYFPVFPPDEWAKLDKEKKKKLAAAIQQVLVNDPEVRELLKAKTMDVFNSLQKS